MKLPAFKRQQTDSRESIFQQRRRTPHVTSILATLILCATATTALANMGNSSLVGSTPTRLYGKWTWTYSKNNCTESYEFRTDNTYAVTSGDEVGESRFTITDKPDPNGFYRMTDVVTKSNGRTGCDGEPGGTPVGDKATNYIIFHPTREEMLMCQSPSLNACFGPLRRVSQ
ncbi:MAG: hypothetical protein HKL98_10480 [Burkholderiales bacterium]|nr:hypothetical protein [Burkholderiales bacterium]